MPEYFSKIPMSDGLDSAEEVDIQNDFDFYEPSSECAEHGVAIVVCKRSDYVLMYLLNRGDLCVMLRKYANVGSVAEFDAKFELAEFYDICFVRVAEQKAFDRFAFEWMCTADEVQPNLSEDWMLSRVIPGGFVQVYVCCNFVDACIVQLGGNCWIVSTDLGDILFDKSFIKEHGFHGKALDLWATFVREDSRCHWQIFVSDNFDALSTAHVEKSVEALYDELHTETTSTPVASPTKQEMDGQRNEGKAGDDRLVLPRSSDPALRSPEMSLLQHLSSSSNYNNLVVDPQMIRPVTYADLRTQTEEILAILARVREEVQALREELRAERRSRGLQLIRGGDNDGNQ